MHITKNIGTENTRWDLSSLYAGIDDPKLDADVAEVIERAEAFKAAHKDRLKTTLSAALQHMAEIDMLVYRIFIFTHLVKSLDVSNEKVAAKEAEIDMKVKPALAGGLAFFDVELCQLTDEEIAALADADPFVGQHLPLIGQKRAMKPHLFSDEVEAALAKRSMFGPSAWTTYYRETEAALRFEFDGKSLGMEEILHVLSEDKDADRRAKAMKTLNDGLKASFADLAAFSLYQVTGKKTLDDKERRFQHPMSYQNLENMVPDATVEALHVAVNTVGADLARRYYRLKRKVLGLEQMRWSDRNAPLPFSDATIVPFDEAMKIVLEAYHSFSPTLADLVREFIAKKRIDAHVTPNRDTGAYNYSGVFAGGEAMSFTFLNYLGSRRDIMTVAHELGHGVHGILGGRAQGVLQFGPPIAYCETASIFGEMTTFNHLLKTTTGFEPKMSLLCGKIEDILNSVVRQISFSNFERRIHGDGKRRGVKEVNGIWMEETIRLYGPNDDVFRYEDMDAMWSYVGHFHRPFYVYGYAFGELLTQSLYAKKEALGAKFEPLYLDMLKAGGTKDAVELLKPFGLDPTDPKFWSAGIEVSLGRMIDEAERLWTGPRNDGAPVDME